MSLMSIFDVSGSGMSAQSVRMNTIASNMANANSVSGDPTKVYRSKQPVFQTIMSDAAGNQASAGVRVIQINEKPGEPRKLHDPTNPLADKKGYIYQSNVNAIEEMANMISASRSFQNNIEVASTAKKLLMATLRMGQ
ncbi:Flagellar basal-body rod protein FlgC [hydrothermal vent metagenome]|uniref:Flagellar basal-body rod protein FlgC n=1 Tax=hydrothermal vent metagenome TaxID=652676 RepID=A0A3B0YZV6_9ZZZZ